MKAKSLSQRSLAVVLTTLLLLVAIPATAVFAASSGPLDAGAGASVAGGGTATWSNPGNITVAGSLYATASVLSGVNTQYLQATSYGFNIPSNATINGITVAINRQAGSTSNASDNIVRLLKAGTLVGANQASVASWPNNFFGQATYNGGADPLWGTTWTPADINDANFGVALSAQNGSSQTRTLTVDYIRITVTYTVSADGIAPTVNTFTVTTPSTNLNVPITAFTASDNVLVTGYLVTTSSTPPAAGALGWTGTAPTTYTVASDGSYTLYPWAKDAAGNVSAVFGSPRTVMVDTTAPTISISAPSVSSTTSGPVDYTVTYVDANFNSSTLAVGNITLTKTGSANGTVSVDVGTGATRTVTISGITGEGNLRISIAPGTASDLVGNLAPAAGPSALFHVHNTPVTYYVDKTNLSCLDAGPGTTPSVPFCTIGKGASVALLGDTVHVLAGSYAETVNGPNSGSASLPITYLADSGVTVTGNLAGSNAFRMSGKSYIVVDGFTITGTTDYGIYVGASNHITISNNHVSDSGSPTDITTTRMGIYFISTTDSTITGNTSDHNSSHGILLTAGSNNNMISDNIAFANAEQWQRNANGIRLQNASTGNTILHNITYANEDSGLNFYLGSSNNLVLGNASYGNGDHGIDFNASPNNTIIGNTVQGNVTAGINLEGAAAPGSGGATLANNIMLDNGLRHLAGGGTSGGQSGNLRFDANSLTGNNLDYNLFHLNSGTVQISWGVSDYPTLAVFQSWQPSQEIHGLEANPLFSAPAPVAERNDSAPYWVAINVGDYHLLGGSPAIDSANSASPEPTLDIEGNARVDNPFTTNTGAGTRTYDDRGAYEFQPKPTTTSVNCGATPTVTYGSSIACVATVTASSGTPTGTVSWTTGGAGSFTTSPCTLSSGSCSVSYTPSSVGTGSHLITASYAGGAGFLSSNGPQTVTVSPVALTITAQHDDRVYNGTNSSLVAPQITSGALVAPDSATLVQTFDTRHVGTGKTLSAAGSTISDGNGGNNYAVTFVDDTSGAITTYALEVTAAPDSKTYDGDNTSAGVPTLTLGILQGSDTATWTQTFDDKHAGTGKTLTPAGSVSDGNGGNNYAVTLVPVTTGSISTLAITVTAVTDSKVYDGNVTSLVEPNISPALVGSDTEGFSQTFDTRDVGTVKTLTPAGSVSDGNGGNNYVVTLSPVTTGEITTRAIEVTATSGNKTYDGSNSSSGVPTITSGSLASGDSANWTQSFDNQNAGNGKTLTPTGSINDGNGGLNYSVSFVTALGNITPADLNVTANDKIIHFGDPTPAFDFSSGGFISPDTFVTAPTCSVADPHTAVGTYPIVCSGGDAGTNYNILYHDGVFTVSDKVILDVTAPSPTITYGDASPTFTPSITGFTGGDDASVLDTAPTCTAGVGPFTAVGSPFAVTCSGGVDDKYDFNYIAGSLTVNPKALTITANNASKTYGSIATFTGAEFTAPGLVGSDSVSSVTLTSTGAAATAAVGSYNIVSSAAVGTGLGNYTISYANGTLTVNPKTLSITASNASKIYGATKTFAGTEFTSLGLVGTDTVTSVTLTSSGAVATANVGTYNIVPSAAVGTGLGNYTVTYANGTLSVNKAGLTVTAANQTKAFGAVDPTFTFTLTGLQNGEAASVIDTAPTCGVSGAHGTPGLYPIVCSGGLDNNYNFVSYVNGTLTVSGVNSATFADVPLTYWSWQYVEALYAAGVTGGCGTGPLIYCPTAPVTRAQMAVFILKAKHGAAYTPPAATGTVFTDVTASSFAAAWIEQLAAENITGGCGGGNYCPDLAVTRDQMAVFLLRGKYGSTYTPPAATGLVFTDVPLGYWAGAWIEALAAEGVTGGCGGGNYCPTTVVTRDQMAVFLVKTFSLPVP